MSSESGGTRKGGDLIRQALESLDGGRLWQKYTDGTKYGEKCIRGAMRHIDPLYQDEEEVLAEVAYNLFPETTPNYPPNTLYITLFNDNSLTTWDMVEQVMEKAAILMDEREGLEDV